MKTVLPSALLCSLFLAGPVVAQAPDANPQYPIQTGEDLGRICANPANANAPTAAERERILVCGAYIRGYLGFYSADRSLTRDPTFCLPNDGISAEKLRVLYLAVLQQRPQIRDFPAAVDLASILKAAYPCKPTAGPTK